MNGPVHPPCWKPPSVSSPACPGPWITPSSEVYSITVILLIAYLLRSLCSSGRSAGPRAGSVRSGHLLRRHPAGQLTGPLACAIRPSHGPRHDQLRDDLSHVAPWRNGVINGAMAAGATLWGEPARVGRVTSGSTPASTWHAVLIQGMVVPSTTSVGTVTLLSCCCGIEKSPSMSAS